MISYCDVNHLVYQYIQGGLDQIFNNKYASKLSIRDSNEVIKFLKCHVWINQQ